MSVFKERRITLLLLAVFLSAILVWGPWGAIDPKTEEALGWPSQYTRGLRFGVDIIGGSRIILKLEASHITIELATENTDQAYANIRAIFEENLYTSVIPIDPESGLWIEEGPPYDPSTRIVAVEIGVPVTENQIENLIGDYGEVLNVESKISEKWRDEVKDSLQARVDPLGTLGVQFRSLGANLILFEAAGLTPEEAKELLGHQGRLEIFIENVLVLSSEDIGPVDPVEYSLEHQSWVVPFRLIGEGPEKWRIYSSGKAGYPTGIYLDRPFDAIVILSQQLRENAGLNYDENARMLYLDLTLPLLVDAVEFEENFSYEALEFLYEQRGVKTRIILLGEEADFKNVLGTIENLGYPSIENAPERREDWSLFEWVLETCGLKSMPIISEGVAGKSETRMVVTTGGGEEDEKEAKILREVLARRLPVRISYESETSIEARLGAEFLKEALIAGIVALLGVWILVYFRYRHWLIGLAIIGTMICELVIVLGAASVLGWTIGLPELGALIIVIGTGIDHQIIITDEVLRGGLPGAKMVSLSARVSRAFAVIFVAVATTIAAMTLLAIVGFGQMRGFALLIITGLLIAVLVTRPAYARIVSAIVMRRQSKAISS